MISLANHSPRPASSSAVTIPTPGKSILKRPPPPPQSLFSRLTKLLPSQNGPADGTVEDESRTLKRAHFILPQMATVYPIMAANPPYSLAIKEEKKLIEEKEAERRKRVVRRNSVSSSSHEPSESDEWWHVDQVESFYRECSTGREDTPDPAISAAFKVWLSSGFSHLHACGCRRHRFSACIESRFENSRPFRYSDNRNIGHNLVGCLYNRMGPPQTDSQGMRPG